MMAFDFSEKEACLFDSLHQSTKSKFHIPSYIKYEDEYVTLRSQYLYFSGNSCGLQPKSLRKQVVDTLDLQSMQDARKEPGWMPIENERQDLMWKAKELSSSLLGCNPEEIVFMNNLTTNLHLALTAFLPQAMMPSATMPSFFIESDTATVDPLSQHEPDWILIEPEIFHSDMWALKSYVQLQFGEERMEVKELPAAPKGSLPLLDSNLIIDFIKENHHRIKLVFLQAVHFLTGEKIEVSKIAKTCRQYGILFGLDCAHAAGSVFDLDLHDHEVDFAVFCTYKYLNAGAGNLGGLYIHEKHFERPRLAGWWGAMNKFNFDSSEYFIPEFGADGFQLGNPPNLLLSGLVASLRVYEENWKSAIPPVDEAAATRESTAMNERTPPPPEESQMFDVIFQVCEENEGEEDTYVWFKKPYPRVTVKGRHYARLEKKTNNLKVYFQALLKNVVPNRFTMSDPARCGAHLSLALKKSNASSEVDKQWHKFFLKELKSESIIVDNRLLGDVLMMRFAFCALYIDFIDVYRLVSKLKNIVDKFWKVESPVSDRGGA